MCSHESLGAVHMCSHESDTGSLSDQGINEKKKKNDTLQDAPAVTPSNGHVQLIRSVSHTHEQQIIPDEEEDREVTTTLQERDFGLLGPKLDQILHHQIHQIHHHNPHAPADSGEKTAVASHALQNQQLMYAFRPRNPKRSRRFSDQDSDATATATATNSKEEIMVIYKRNPENISTVCAASSSSTTTTPTGAEGGGGGGLNKKSMAVKKKSNWKEKLMASGRPVCSECGKEFHSWKAMFGHMRCHPEREWRGIQPPPHYNHTPVGAETSRTNPRPGLSVAIRGKKAAIINRFKNHGRRAMSISTDLIISSGSEDQARKNQVQLGSVVTDDFDDDEDDEDAGDHGLRLSRWSVNQDQDHGPVKGRELLRWDSKLEPPVLLEEEEESETDQSIEEAYISNSSSNKQVLSIPSSYNYLPNMRGKRSRRSHPTVIKTLKAMESEEAAEALDSSSARLDKYSRQSRSEELDMANCLVMLALAGSFIEQKGEDLLPDEEDEEEQGLGLTRLADELESSHCHNTKLAGPMNQEENLCVSSQVHGFRSMIHGSSAMPFRSSIICAESESESNALARRSEQVISIGGTGRFECTTCKRIFKTHQALGGHRASHKKVKGCFAKSPMLDNLEADSSAATSAAGAAARQQQQIHALNLDGIATEETLVPDADAEHVKPPPDFFFSGAITSSERIADTYAKNHRIHQHGIQHGRETGAEAAIAMLSSTPETVMAAARLVSKSHQCSICLRVFSSGQALGGHKRCHWTAAGTGAGAGGDKGSSSSSSMKQLLLLDLNLPAPMETTNIVSDHHQIQQHHHHQTPHDIYTY